MDKGFLAIKETHIAPPQSKPIRLQEYAVGIFKTANTKSAIKKAIKKEILLVNDAPTTTARLILGGEKLELLAAEKQTSRKVFNVQLDVVYEDDYLAVINKPAGLLVSGNSFKTVDNALENVLTSSSQFDTVRPRPVHRLDFPTTGLLLIGKTQSGIQHLNQLFESKDIQKKYHAVTIGKMAHSGHIQFAVDNKHAETFYKTISTVASKRFSFLNLVELTPSTGRRHQLRKHLSEIGHPILGDQNYGQENLILKGKGLYLHASRLSFVHPFTKDDLTIQSPLPKRFLKIFPQ